MKRETEDITVIVCTRNRPAELDRCLASLAKLYPAAREVIVVNSAGDASAKDIAARHSANYVETDLHGVSRARNLGAAAARTAWIAYLDDDSIAEPNWLDGVSAVFADERVGVVTGRIEPLQESEAAQGSAFGMFRRDRPRSVDRETPNWFSLANFGHIGVGGNMFLRRDVFLRWQGFDNRLGRGAVIPGAEEHFAFFQLIDLGYGSVHLPDSVVRHPALQSEAELRRFHLEMAEIAAAYATLLFVEYPAHRLEVVRQIVSRVLRGPSKDRAISAKAVRISTWQRLRAAFGGLGLYWKTRSSRRFSST